ncbi:hypothetical protein ABT160_23325 [Streptomyces sp. NPDC001941]|uniref:hypothetical protein n=1 Tax=Streptomyces sp. NPDC001941 TaxID=3154659 RepID=UPI0033260150
MAGVRGWRWPVLLVVVVGVVVAANATGIFWQGTARNAVNEQSARAAARAPYAYDASESEVVRTEEEYVDALMPRTVGPGSTRVRFREDGRWTVAISVEYRFRLAASDPVADRLRRSPYLIHSLTRLLPGREVPPDLLDREATLKLRSLNPWHCTLSQASRDGLVTVTAKAEASEVPLGNWSYRLSKGLRDEYGHSVPWLGGDWTWTFTVPANWSIGVEGRPLRQTAHEVTVPANGPAAVSKVALGREPDMTGTPRTVRSDEVRGTAVLLGLLCLFGTAAALLVLCCRAAFPAAVRRRWTVSVALTALVLPLLAVLWTLAHPSDWGRLLVKFTNGWSGTPARDIDPWSDEVFLRGVGQVLIGLALFALPVVVLSLHDRLRTGHPSALPRLLLVGAPAVVLPALARVTGGPKWSATIALTLVSALVCATVLARALRLTGPAGRRWATTAAVATGTWVAASTCLGHVPATPSSLSGRADYAFATLATLWPLSFVVLAPWALLLVLSAYRYAPRTRRPHVAVAGLLALATVAALVPWNAPEANPGYDPPHAADVLTQLTGNAPAISTDTGFAVLAPALQISLLTATVLLLLHLRSTARTPRLWHPTVRPACCALVWLAVLAPLFGTPARIEEWTTSAALLLGWLGPLWLLPLGREARARRLHALSGAAHARLVQSLARTLLFAEGRHRFLTGSRGTLADASLTSQTWQQQWRDLSAGTVADEARATARLRRTALGNSAGSSAWANGVVAAAASFLLTLPWTAWPAWRGRSYSGVPEALTAAGAATGLWVALGFTYGYLYPWLRGRGPIGKAGALFAVAAPLQTLLLAPQLELPAGQAAVYVVLMVAQCAFLALGLGLYWEVRLVRQGDLLWGHVRNFRRLSSLAAPVSTVLVAAVAAAVTVLATSWASSLTEPAPPPPKPTDSASPSAPSSPAP